MDCLDGPGLGEFERPRLPDDDLELEDDDDDDRLVDIEDDRLDDLEDGGLSPALTNVSWSFFCKVLSLTLAL